MLAARLLLRHDVADTGISCAGPASRSAKQQPRIKLKRRFVHDLQTRHVRVLWIDEQISLQRNDHRGYRQDECFAARDKMITDCAARCRRLCGPPGMRQIGMRDRLGKQVVWHLDTQCHEIIWCVGRIDVHQQLQRGQ